MDIIKRDGRKAKFDHMKIVDAILKAFKEIDGTITDYALIKAGNIADYIADYAEECDHDLTIDEIQNFVEKGLMSTKRKDVAKSYIEYRHDRDKERQWNNHMMNVIKEKLQASNVQNQNANVDEHSFGGRKGEADAVLMKEFALDNCMSKKSKKRHLNNEIYIHDLDSYSVGMHNCLTIPFDDLMAKGANTRQTDIRPANSVQTFFQLIAVYSQLQSLQQFGGVSASHIDWSAVPYVRKSFTKHLSDGLRYIENKSKYKIDRFHKWLKNDKENHQDGTIHFDDEEFKNLHPRAWKYAMDMTKKELEQAVEAMYHNLR